MHHRLWRHCSTLLLVIFTLSLIPPQALAAQDIQDAAQRFAQQRASIAGRRDLPVASSGTTAPPASAPAIDQTQRLAQLQQRWAQEQTRDLPPPHAALPVTPSSVYLPGVVQQATPVLAETTAPVELPAYRDARSNVYMYPDGHWETHVYAEPVNYRQPDGSWVPFRPLLRPTIGAQAGSTAGYEPDGTNLDVQFAAPTAAAGIAATSSLVYLRQGELQIGFTPRAATLTNASVQGAAIIYADAFPHADLRYTVTGPSIKEEVIFAQAPAVDFALTFDLQLQGGHLRQQGQAVLVLDGEGRPQFEIAAPFLVDANGVISTQVQVELQPSNAGTPSLRYTPDAAWLADPARAYPVILDPTIGPITPAGDTYVAENPSADADHHFEAALFLGYATAGIDPIKGRSRFFMNFSLPALPSGMAAADIDSATLSLYQYWDERGGSYEVELYPTNDPWNEAGIRWGTQPGRGARHSVQTVSAGRGHKSFNLTTLVQSWYNNGTPTTPRGVAFIAKDEDQPAGRFASSACASTPTYCNPLGDPNPRPYLSISYTPVPVGTDEIRISESLSFAPNTPNNPPLRGTNVTARFKLKNVSSRTIPIPTLQVKMKGPSNTAYDFPAATGLLLNPGQEYTYSQSRTLPEGGLYFGQAQFFDGSAWYRVYIDPGSGFVNARQYLMKDPLPPPEQRSYGPDGPGGRGGDPVNTSTGNFASPWVDATLPDVGLGLSFGRTFNSLDTERTGLFGLGWTSTYEEQLLRRIDESVVYVRGDGQRVYFQARFKEVYAETGGKDGDVTYVPDGTYTTEDGFDLTLARDLGSGAWTLTDQDLTLRTFDADGRLQRIADRYGSTIALGYNQGKLVTIASANQSCTLSWSAERVTSIACPTGALRYSYTAGGDLAAVTNLANETTQYAYDGAHRVITITDGNGRLIVENVYDGLGRVTQQREGITPWTSFSYAPASRTTIYRDANGHRMTDTHDERDRLTRREDELGNVDSYTYDADDHLLSHTNTLGATWHYTYDATGNLLTEVDPLGATWRYTYNDRNQRIAQTDPLGQTTNFTYTGDLLQASRNALGGVRSYESTPAGLITKLADELGHSTSRTYTAAGQIRTETDALGATTTYEYNAAGDLIAVVDALGNRARYTYDAQHRLLSLVDPAGGTTRFAYDTMGNLVRETNSLGDSRQLFYDGNHRLIGVRDFSGAVTEYFYDGLGNLTRMVDALSQATRFEYDAANRLLARIDPLGNRWSYSYDRLGRLQTETDPLGRVIRHEYDALGRETRTVDARGNAVARSYDLLGRVVTETSQLGAVTTSTYDPLGRLTAQTDGLGQTTRYTYDVAHRLVQTIDALGKPTMVAYDAANRPVQLTDRAGAVTRYTYDRVGRLIAQTDPRGATTRTQYDALDRPVVVTDALGHATTHAYDAAGRKLRETDALGFSRSWTYDAQGRELTATDRTGATTTTSYDPLGRTIQIKNVLGGVRLRFYDAAGHQTAETDEQGRTRRSEYDGAGNQIKTIDPLGGVTISEYDANNNAIRTTDALGGVTRTEYDAANNPLRTIDALGNVQTTDYDILGRPVATRDPYGAATRTEYDALGRAVRTIDPRGAITTTAYDAEGRALTITNALNAMTTTTYDAAGSPLMQTDANGNQTRTEYDLLGRAVRVIDPLGQLSQTHYDDVGNVIKTVDPRGATTTMRYDRERRQLARIDALGQTWRTEYDALGRAVRTINPLGHVETSEYDAVGNVVRAIKPGGQVTKTVYDANNNPIATTDARGFVTSVAYDALNRPIATTEPLGTTASTRYDLRGQAIEQLDGNGHALRMSYDRAGRLATVTDALSQTVRLSYDTAGAQIAALDGNGHRTRTEYDLLGRPTATIDALGNRTTMRYDAAGNVIEERRANGATIATRYDALNRQVSAQLAPGGTETTTYDPIGNVIARTGGDGQQRLEYDLLGRVVRTTDSGGSIVAARYDAAGRRTHTIYPDSRAVVTSFDANGWPTTIDDGRGNRTTLSYDADGRLLDLRYPASASRAAYDAKGQLVKILNEGANGPFAAYEYTLDKVGNRTSERISTLTLGGLVTLEQTSYTYDAIDRLIRSQRSGPTTTALDQRYTYDAAGNRTSITATENGRAWTQQLRYDPADRLLETVDSRSGTTRYTYDAAGNRLSANSTNSRQSYTYDARGRLLTVTQRDANDRPVGSVQHARYDSLNRRIVVEQRDASGELLASERTLYDGDSWNVLAQIAAGGSPQWFVAHPQSLGHLSVETAGVVRFAHTDGLGSYVAYTDRTGSGSNSLPTRYGDWGAVESGAANLASSYGYTGHRQDASGLLYARNRVYDPASATWLTSDPFPAQMTEPGSVNRFSYVRGNPITRTDPLGLFDWATGTVQPGDTLWGIAQAAGTSVQSLLALNPQVSNANMIYAGQHLNVNGSSAASHANQQYSGAQTMGTSRPQCGAKCGTSYTIQSGDTLSGIGMKFNIPWEAIYNANKSVIGGSPNTISIGQKLYIPCFGGTGEKVSTNKGGKSTLLPILEQYRKTKFLIKQVEQQIVMIKSMMALPGIGFGLAYTLWLYGEIAHLDMLRAVQNTIVQKIKSIPRGAPEGGNSECYTYKNHGYAMDCSRGNGKVIATHSGSVIDTKPEPCGQGRWLDIGWVPCREGAGQRVKVKSDTINGEWYETIYLHMKSGSIRVKVGDRVDNGTWLGTKGCTGLCGGPHVHYEVYKNGVPQDTRSFIDTNPRIDW